MLVPATELKPGDKFSTQSKMVNNLTVSTIRRKYVCGYCKKCGTCYTCGSELVVVSFWTGIKVRLRRMFKRK